MKPTIAALLLAILPATHGIVVAQEDPTVSRLSREQSEILRKTERLKELMGRLLARYERDGRTEQVRLLKSGIEHLEKSRLLVSASAIQGNLDNGALDNALRDQASVVAELEALLDILLDRQSIENIDEEIDKTERLMDQASALIERQQQLRKEAQEARDQRTSAAEQQLLETLADLAGAQREEAAENSRQAGLRLPVIESAMRRLRGLLQSQKKLEQSAQEQLGGGRSKAREQAFELGSIENEQRELMDRRGEQRDLDRVAEAADELEQAAGTTDRERLQESYDRLRARLESQAAKSGNSKLSEELDKLQDLSPAATDAEARAEMQAAAKRVSDAAKQASQAKGAAIDTDQKSLADRARKASDANRDEKDGKPVETPTSRALDSAADSMERANKRAQEQGASEALAESSTALRKLSDARRRQRDANPSPSKRASDMAAASDQLSRDLENAPHSERPEQDAAKALEDANKALRDTADELGQDDAGERATDANKVESGLQSSRAALEKAMQSLQSAMQSASQGREQSTQAAQQRQQQLRQRAEGARQDVQRAEQQGDLSPEQAKAAEQAIQQAMKSMEQAEQRLQNGQQSSASNNQSQAAEQLDKAQEGIRQNRPLTEQEKQNLEQVAEKQKQLEEDIIDLAKLVEERQNRRASQALKEAQQASQRASRALEEGKPEEADEQQAEAEQKLEEARQELEEERDRYLDLRQEELLFKIGEELTEFLEAQRPLTEQTEAAGEVYAEKGKLSRPARRKLNQVGERELELIARTEFILQALVEEGVLVFSHALKANVADLKEVADRLSGRRPDPSEFTVMLQRDVEMRAEQLLAALKREQERRQNENQGQQQQQNQFGNQKQPLVPLIAELKMLKRMEEDMQQRTEEIERLIAAAGADGVTEFDLALAERLAHQHAALTDIFKKIKSGIEQQMQQGEGADDPFDDGEDKGPEDRDQDEGRGR